MTLEKLPLEGNLKDPITLKVNEIIDYINKVERMFGMDGIESPPEATRDLYKEDQVKGNEI